MIVIYAEAELRDWNLSNPQDGVLAPSQSQTKPPGPANKPLLHHLRVRMGFQDSLSSPENEAQASARRAGTSSDVGGEGLGLVSLFPKPEPYIVDSS